MHERHGELPFAPGRLDRRAVLRRAGNDPCSCAKAWPRSSGIRKPGRRSPPRPRRPSPRGRLSVWRHGLGACWHLSSLSPFLTGRGWIASVSERSGEGQGMERRPSPASPINSSSIHPHSFVSARGFARIEPCSLMVSRRTAGAFHFPLRPARLGLAHSRREKGGRSAAWRLKPSVSALAGGGRLAGAPAARTSLRRSRKPFALRRLWARGPCFRGREPFGFAANRGAGRTSEALQAGLEACARTGFSRPVQSLVQPSKAAVCHARGRLPRASRSEGHVSLRSERRPHPANTTPHERAPSGWGYRNIVN